MHSEAAILLILGHFIIIVIALTIFWRMATAMDTVANALVELSKDLKKLTADSSRDKKE